MEQRERKEPTMGWTYEEILADLQAARTDRPKPKPVVAKLATDHKLSVDGQRERVSHVVAGLIEAEKNRQLAIETHRQRMRRQREEGLYYQELYRGVAEAEYWAKQPARRAIVSEVEKAKKPTYRR
jgi:hypothetical protein